MRYAAENGQEESKKENPDTEEADSLEIQKDGKGDVLQAKDLKLTPKAKKLVREEGIDPESLKDIKGTGYEAALPPRISKRRRWQENWRIRQVWIWQL